MGEFALGQACRDSRIRGCCAAAAAMSTTWSCRAWPSATCCARRTRMPAFARSTPPRRRRRRACWPFSPAPIGRRRAAATCRCRRDQSAATARRSIVRPIPALVKDRVRWVGDYVAFVVAETRAQAADAAELIEVDYEPLPAIVSTADAVKPGRAAACGTIARTISASSISKATRPRPMRPSPAPTALSSATW